MRPQTIPLVALGDLFLESDGTRADPEWLQQPANAVGS